MKKLTKINAEMPNKNNVKDIFDTVKKGAQKGVQIGVLGTALATGAALGVGCAQPTDSFDNGQTIETSRSTPYDKTMGNGNYTIHNFIGEEPNIMPYTEIEDWNRYCGTAEYYLKNLASDFKASLNGRTSAQSLFSRLITETSNSSLQINAKNPGGREFDTYVNQISTLCEPVFATIIKNLTDEADRNALILCYAVLGNEAYKEGLGKYRAESSSLFAKYTHERDLIEAKWSSSSLNSINFTHDVDDRKCKQITDRMDILLNRAVSHMNGSSTYREVTIKDIRRFINLALTTNSLEAMHDYSATTLNHQRCNLNLGILSAMEDASKEAALNWPTYDLGM